MFGTVWYSREPDPLASFEGRPKSGARGAALQKALRPLSVSGWQGGSGIWSAAPSGAAFAVPNTVDAAFARTDHRGLTTSVFGSVWYSRVPDPLASFEGHP